MRKTFCFLLLGSILSGASSAAANVDAAVAIAKLANTRELYQKAFMTTFDPHMKQLEATGRASAEQVKKIRKEAKLFANTIYDDPGFLEGIAAIYRKEFTKKELDALLVFYRSELGKKVLMKMPTLFQAGVGVGQSLAAKHQPKFQKKVQAIMTGTDVDAAEPINADKKSK